MSTHPLTAAIRKAVGQFTDNHQSLSMLMVNTLCVIVEMGVGPLLSAAIARAEKAEGERDRAKGLLHEAYSEPLPEELSDRTEAVIYPDRAVPLVGHVTLAPTIPATLPHVEHPPERVRTVPLVDGGATTLPVESKREVMPYHKAPASLAKVEQWLHVDCSACKRPISGCCTDSTCAEKGAMCGIRAIASLAAKVSP